MKSKTIVVLITIIILGLGAFGTWLYLKPVNSYTLSGFVKILKHNGYNVKDITKEYIKDFSKDQLSKIPYPQKVFNVNGQKVFVNIGKTEDINIAIQRHIEGLNNPSIDYTGIPHLYNKDNLEVVYFGSDKKLLKTLEEVLGKSLVN